jgi:glycosyltransferase involved in cell wall biosynthesis
MMPDRRPHWVIQQIAAKSAVAYPGCHFTPDARCFEQDKQDPPLIIWNHRWEHDKNPVVFFKALRSLQRRGIAFRLALLGEHYRNHPPEFEAAAVQFREHLVHFGYVPSRNEYYQWLRQGSVVVSTALQENFGIAVVEAMRHGCLPIVPKQLSFPEIVPRWLHADCLYRDQDDLEEKLAAQVLSSRDRQDTRKRLCSAMRPYAWPVAIGRFDQELGRLADRSSR